MKLKLLAELILKATIILVIAVGIAYAFEAAIEKQDRADCLTWQSQAKEFPGYFLTKDQKAQCDYFNIEVNAPVTK